MGLLPRGSLPQASQGLGSRRLILFIVRAPLESSDCMEHVGRSPHKGVPSIFFILNHDGCQTDGRPRGLPSPGGASVPSAQRIFFWSYFSSRPVACSVGFPRWGSVAFLTLPFSPTATLTRLRARRFAFSLLRPLQLGSVAPSSLLAALSLLPPRRLGRYASALSLTRS